MPDIFSMPLSNFMMLDKTHCMHMNITACASLTQPTVLSGLFQATVLSGLLQATVLSGLLQTTVPPGLIQTTVPSGLMLTLPLRPPPRARRYCRSHRCCASMYARLNVHLANRAQADNPSWWDGSGLADFAECNASTVGGAWLTPATKLRSKLSSAGSSWPACPQLTTLLARRLKV